MNFIRGLILTLLSLASLPAIAQQPLEKPSNDEIAKQLANPNTPLATMRLKNLYTFYKGDLPGAGSQSNYSMLFQPSFPFPLASGDTVFWRPALPIIFEQPVRDIGREEFVDRSGLGDIAMDFAYGKTSDSGILTALGAVTTLPTATNHLGREQWLLRPEFLLGKITPESVIGIFPSHQWNIAGEDSFDTSLTSIQMFATILPGDGWAFGSEWIIGFNVAPVVENVLAGLFSKD